MKEKTKLTHFELLYLLGQPFFTYHLVQVRKDVKALVARYPATARLLDVGARKSHYTIGLNAEVVLLDVPRQTTLQNQLGLGVTNEVLAQLQRRRSNVREYLVGDFLTTDLPNTSFDIVTAIEVIEHVQEDSLFVEKAYRVLKPGGVFYLTTPNGVTVPNRNPDHLRHYTAEKLATLLHSSFREATIEHGEIKTMCWKKGLGFWKPNRPLRMAVGMIANLINHVENRWIGSTALNSVRLFATAWKE